MDKLVLGWRGQRVAQLGRYASHFAPGTITRILFRPAPLGVV